MDCTEIVRANKRNVYIPVFNVETGKYEDKLPYIAYQRERQTYDCRCKAGTIFTNNTEFKNHVKSECHKRWLQNYEAYYKGGRFARRNS